MWHLWKNFVNCSVPGPGNNFCCVPDSSIYIKKNFFKFHNSLNYIIMLEKKLTNRFRRTFWHPAARSGSSGRRKQGHFKPVRNCKGKNPSPKPQPIYLKVFLNCRPISASFSPQIFIATRVAIIQRIFVITLSAIIVWSVRINKNSMYFTIVVTRIVIMRKISFFYFVI